MSMEVLDSLVQLVQSEQLTGSVTDTEAAELLGVSRTPVREAFRRLVDFGLLRPLGRRFEVIAVSREYVVMVEEARGLWTELAVWLASRANCRGRFEELAQEFENIGSTAPACGATELVARWHSLIRRFRDATHEACGNPLLVEQLEVMSLHQDRFGQRPENAHTLVGHFAQARAEVCRAVAAGDAESARRSQRELVREFQDQALAWFAQDDPGQAAAPMFRASDSAIYQRLRDELLLAPALSGSILVPDEIAERYGVSRTPVREALDLAEVRGLVVRQHGVGTRVRERTIALYANKLQLFAPVSQWVLRKIQRAGEPLPLSTCAERFLALADEASPTRRFAPDFAAAQLEYYRTLAEHSGNWLVGNALMKLATLHVFYQTPNVFDDTGPYRDAARLRHQQCRALVEDPAGDTALHMSEKLRKTSLQIAGAWFARAAASPADE